MKNVYRRAWLLAVLLMWSFASFAQGKLVSGTVLSSSDGSSMPGVNVLLKGTTTGAATDAEGKFSIAVPSDESVLVFSFIGHTSQEVVVGSRTVVDVTLQEDISQLGEVVVTALGI